VVRPAGLGDVPADSDGWADAFSGGRCWLITGYRPKPNGMPRPRPTTNASASGHIAERERSSADSSIGGCATMGRSGTIGMAAGTAEGLESRRGA